MAAYLILHGKMVVDNNAGSLDDTQGIADVNCDL